MSSSFSKFNNIVVGNDKADADDFPFIVMEFFKDSYVASSKGDTEICIDAKSNAVSSALKEAYDQEKDAFLLSKIDIPTTDARVCVARWAHIKHIVVIEASPVQIYFARSLNHPHYAVHPLEYKSYLQHIKEFKKTSVHPQLTFCKNSKNHKDIAGMVTITNKGMSLPLVECIQGFQLQELMRLVSRYGGNDSKRGNIQVDTGLTSSVCQLRRKEYMGVPGPNQLQHTTRPEVKRMYALLYQFLDLAVPKEFRGKLYMDPARHTMFAFDTDVHQDPQVLLQSARVSLSHKCNVLVPHRDSKNDNDDPMFSPVLVLSWLLQVGVCEQSNKSQDVRLPIIVYSRSFVSETLAKVQKYRKAIKDVSDFYEKKRIEGKAELSSSIFEQAYKVDGTCSLKAARIIPQMDTVLHWSAMGADALFKINMKYSPNYQQGLALLYSVCACESPDLFRVFTDRLLREEAFGKDFFKKDAIHIAITVYEIIWELKLQVALDGHGMKGQRHQPFANRKANRRVIHTSLTNIVSVSDKFHAWNGKSWKCKKHVRELYLGALSSLIANHKDTGAYGAGPLVANKLLQTGALVGLFPTQFLFESKIAESTNTYEFLKTNYKLTAKEIATPILLDAIAFMTDTNPRVAEGACCKAGRAWHSKSGSDSEKRWVDTIYHDMNILTVRSGTSGRLNSIAIFEITREGERVVHPSELQWQNGGNVKDTPWSTCCGYWAETLDGPTIVRNRKTSKKKKYTPKKKKPVKVSAVKTTRKRKTPPLQDVPPAKRHVSSSAKRVGRMAGVSQPRLALNTPRNKKPTWKYPSQADVMGCSENSKMLFPLMTLFSRALGIPKGVTAQKTRVSYTRTQTETGNRVVIPFVTCTDGSRYDPPVPNRNWKNTLFQRLPEGKVCFPSSKSAFPYTVLHFIQSQFKSGFEKYLSDTMEWNTCEFIPHKAALKNNESYPEKMIVFYSHEDRNHKERVPVAICLKIDNGNGVFVPVDNFGKPYKASKYIFPIA